MQTLKEMFAGQAEWRRQKAVEHPTDDRNLESAALFDQLAETVEGVNPALLQAYEELFEEFEDNAHHSELMRSVGFQWWPKDATEFVSAFVANRTSG